LSIVTSQALEYDVITYAPCEGLHQGWPTYGACAKSGALDDLKWRIVYL